MDLPTPPATIFDVTEANFETDVLKASIDTPILIDFWADWCGPCKALSPVLDKLADEYQGAFRLGKINVDQAQELAGMFGIRSIPTVMLVMGGKPVDGFAGALPEGQIREFLAQHLALQAPAEEAAVVEDTADVETPDAAVTRLRQAMTDQPDQPELRLDLIGALLQAGQVAEAETELAALPADLATDPRANASRSQLELAHALDGAPDLATLQQRVQADANDWSARDLLGVRLLLGPSPDAGLEEFLYILKHARNWNDGQAKKRLLAAFATLDDAVLVGTYRRRMAALLF